MAILFHHSNSRLPYRLELWLSRIVMTPRMHGIHHSIIEREVNSNWSTIFSWPDYLHGTQRLNVPQEAVDIGVPSYRDPAELTLPNVLRMPFGPQRPRWRLPDGTEPDREPPSVPEGTLAP